MDVLHDFCFGIEFFRYPGPPPEALYADLQRFRESGLRCIRLQSNWAYEEPLEGQYDFSKLEALLRRAQELGMEAILTVCLENAPAWLFAQYDVYQADAAGNPVRHSLPYPIPGDGKPGPCFDHPAAVEKAERYAAALVTRLGAFPNVIAWSIWQEARSVGGVPLIPGQALCWCEHTRQAFIRWMQERYGTLDAANAALLTRYGDWQHILPPYLLYQNMKQCPLYMHYAQFLRERTGRIARWKRELVRRHDPARRPVLCHTVQAMVEAGLENQWADEYILAGEVDGFGISAYPKWGTKPYLENEDMEALLLPLDAARCAADGRPVWVAELQFGRPGSLLERAVKPTARDLENWIFAAIARNAKGIIGWSYRDERFCLESYSHGILDQEGEPHEWFSALPKLAAFLERNRRLLGRAAPPPAAAAILICADSYLLAHMADREALAVNAAKGFYLALLRRGVRADFVWEEQLTPQRLAAYETVFLPFPLVLDTKTAALLCGYVSAGGHLIAEACPGSYMKNSCAERRSLANGLERLFGCRERDLFETADPAVAGEPVHNGAGRTVRPVHFIQTYTCTTAAPTLWCGGQIAGVRNRFGRGTAELVGTFFAAEAENAWILEEWMGLRPHRGLAVWELNAEAGRVLIFYNPSESPAAFSDAGAPSDRYGGALTREGARFTLTVAGKTSACLVFSAASRQT